MFRSGAFVADHVTPTDEEQVQPAGVDLRLDAVHEPVETGRIGRDGKRVGDRRAVDPDPETGDYHLDRGGYVATYAERVRIPEGHVGLVLPRSSLLRNGAMLDTALWDTGYEGRGEGLLEVHHPVRIEPGARFAQFVLAAADHDGAYEGDYQSERL